MDIVTAEGVGTTFSSRLPLHAAEPSDVPVRDPRIDPIPLAR